MTVVMFLESNCELYTLLLLVLFRAVAYHAMCKNVKTPQSLAQVQRETML